jgi:hypothetical protein
MWESEAEKTINLKNALNAGFDCEVLITSGSPYRSSSTQGIRKFFIRLLTGKKEWYCIGPYDLIDKNKVIEKVNELGLENFIHQYGYIVAD